MTISEKIDNAIHKEARATRAERAFKHEGVKEALDSVVVQPSEAGRQVRSATASQGMLKAHVNRHTTRILETATFLRQTLGTQHYRTTRLIGLCSAKVV